MNPSCVLLTRANASKCSHVILWASLSICARDRSLSAQENAGLLSLKRLWKTIMKRGPTTCSRRGEQFRLDNCRFPLPNELCLQRMTKVQSLSALVLVHMHSTSEFSSFYLNTPSRFVASEDLQRRSSTSKSSFSPHSSTCIRST